MAKFRKGKSGNPSGRTKGVLDRRNRFSEMIAAEGDPRERPRIAFSLPGAVMA